MYILADGSKIVVFVVVVVVVLVIPAVEGHSEIDSPRFSKSHAILG